MAFQRKQQQGTGQKPLLSVQLSVKQADGYIKGPSFGFFPNDQGGPAFRSTISGERLSQVAEFLCNALEADMPVIMAMFDNSGNAIPHKPSAPASGGFKKPSAPAKKFNPFKKPEQQEEDPSQEPRF